MLAKREAEMSVSWDVTFFRLGVAALAVVGGSGLLVGCGAIEQGSKAVGEQVQRDTFKPSEATSEGVSIHVYLDQSASNEVSRQDTGMQLVDLLDTYPESAKTTVYWYATDVKKISTIFSSKAALQEIVSQYDTDPTGDPPQAKGTMLSLAFRDLQTQAAREPNKRVVGIFVTDGGFEDDQSVLSKEAMRTGEIPNIAMIAFVGLDARGTTKLSLLDSVVKDNFVALGGKQYFDITVQNGAGILAQAKKALQSEIVNTKQSSASTASDAPAE